MKSISLALLLSAGLAGGAIAAEDKAAPHGASGHDKQETGKMQGSPNAAGFDKKNDASGSGSMSGTSGPSTKGTEGSSGSAKPQ